MTNKERQNLVKTLKAWCEEFGLSSLEDCGFDKGVDWGDLTEEQLRSLEEDMDEDYAKETNDELMWQESLEHMGEDEDWDD